MINYRFFLVINQANQPKMHMDRFDKRQGQSVKPVKIVYYVGIFI